jgi:hydroxyacylglutathione hydrolase
MKIETFVLGNIRSNCYVIYEDNRCFVIDPGFDDDNLHHFIDAHQLLVEAIYITHGHYDHVGGVNLLKKKHQCMVYAPKADAMFLELGDYNKWGIPIDVDIWIDQETDLNFLGYTFNVLLTPGHSPGGTVLFHDGLLFSGDTLFYQSIGRTDLPFSSGQDIYQSIKKLYQLFADDTKVFPGHGRTTTIGHEKHFNPFVREK